MSRKKFTLIVIAVITVIASCKKMSPCNSNDYYGAVVSTNTVTDYDGNVYNIVKIGNQNWLQQNLKTTHYQNGTPIIQGSETLTGMDSISWDNIYNNGAQTPAWCYYNGDSVNNTIFGKLYNWYAVNDNQLCPAGFHVPSDAEWHTLALTLDGCAVIGDPESNSAGGQLKAITIWTKGDSSANNLSKFTAYPAGSADPTRTFNGLDSLSYFWTSSTGYAGTGSAWDRKLNTEDSSVGRFNGLEGNGFSVRCVGN